MLPRLPMLNAGLIRAARATIGRRAWATGAEGPGRKAALIDLGTRRRHRPRPHPRRRPHLPLHRRCLPPRLPCFLPSVAVDSAADAATALPHTPPSGPVRSSFSPCRRLLPPSLPPPPSHTPLPRALGAVRPPCESSMMAADAHRCWWMQTSRRGASVEEEAAFTGRRCRCARKWQPCSSRRPQLQLPAVMELSQGDPDRHARSLCSL